MKPFIKLILFYHSLGAAVYTVQKEMCGGDLCITDCSDFTSPGTVKQTQMDQPMRCKRSCLQFKVMFKNRNGKRINNVYFRSKVVK